MATRLRTAFPDIADHLDRLARPERSALVERIAREATERLGVIAPNDADDLALARWARTMDETGWFIDRAGESAQHEADFLRARAASSLRFARSARTSDVAAADSVYESIVAIGEDAVRTLMTT